MMTRDEYNSFRAEVQSKTDGANVHYINGRLGLIATSISLIEERSHRLSDDKIEYYKQLIPEWIKEINIKLNEKYNKGVVRR